jgi:glycosyltransferase involved in cell wall biosynthesis
MRLGILTSHPIQYQAPWFRGLAQGLELEVFFAHQQAAREQSDFGVAFEWDVDLLSGYPHRFLRNVAGRPSVNHFSGCDTPEVAELIRGGGFGAFIVSGWYLKSYWQAVRACRRAGVPVLVRGDSQLRTPRSWFKRLWKEVSHRWLLRHFDGFMVVGERNREYLRHYGVPAARMFDSPHFVDNAWFAARAAQARPSRAVQRADWGAAAGTVVALFVGKFIAKKRPGDLLLALRRLAEIGAQRDVLGVFVGSGELEGALQAEANRLGVAARFVGFKNQTELPRCYVSADVLVLPSDGGETWGLVVNEAMACGLPAIVSDAVGCAPDLIEAGQTGFTFPVGDGEALADRVRRFTALHACGHDFGPALRAKMSRYSLEAATQGAREMLREFKVAQPGRRDFIG